MPICYNDADCKDDEKCNIVTHECYAVCLKPNVCGKGAICKALKSKAECECLPGYRGNPYVECSVRDSCTNPSDCPGNLLCLGEYCGCPYPYKQHSSFCILSTLNHTCTSSTSCPIGQHCVFASREDNIGYCACPKGSLMTLEGTCRDYNECEEKSFPCGPGAKCFNKVGALGGGYDCRCPLGTVGDPFVGCFPEQPQKNCLQDSDCPSDKNCINSQCRDACAVENRCGQNAQCYVENHQRKCKCRSGFVGNPVDVCRPIIDCSSDSNCPGNLACLSDRRCGCPANFNRVLDYCTNRLTNCSTNSPCPDNQECIYSGSESGFCVCPRGFRANSDGSCRDVNECSNQLTCGPNTQCVNLPGSYKCICNPGYSGEDPYRDGCQIQSKEQDSEKGCSSDSDCPLTKKCDYATRSCVDACSTKDTKCGINAICSANNHMMTCTCPSGYEGNPYKHCFIGK